MQLFEIHAVNVKQSLSQRRDSNIINITWTSAHTSFGSIFSELGEPHYKSGQSLVQEHKSVEQLDNYPSTMEMFCYEL